MSESGRMRRDRRRRRRAGGGAGVGARRPRGHGAGEGARIGSETSSRNSEVIHAGLYYPRRQPQGALLRRRPRAALCLLRRARRPAPAHRQARSSPPARASSRSSTASWRNGRRRTASTISNGSAATRRARSSRSSRCVAAFLSPSTGIIDSHALMLAYQGDAEAAGAMVVLRAPVLGGRVRATASSSRSAAPSR